MKTNTHLCVVFSTLPQAGGSGVNKSVTESSLPEGRLSVFPREDTQVKVTSPKEVPSEAGV